MKLELKNDKGFTLLELMIAIFILLVISMLIFQISSQSVRARNRQDQYNKIYQSARVAMRKMTDDFSMAYLAGPSFTSTAADGSTVMETAFIGEDNSDADSVFFNTFSHRRMIQDSRESDQAEVAYYTEADEENKEILRLMRRESSVVDSDVKTQTEKGFVLAEGLKGFNVEYYQQQANEWMPSWSSKDPRSPGKLPRAVRITLTYINPSDSEKEIVFTSAAIVELSDAAIEF